MRSSRPIRGIDRVVPGVGRITIRGGRMTRAYRDELDRAITKAVRSEAFEQLTLLKARRIFPLQFHAASQRNALESLRPRAELRPLIDRWLKMSDLRESSRVPYRQSWKLILASLPANVMLDDLTNTWWKNFALGRDVSNATLNRDRAAILAFSTWAREDGHWVADLKAKRSKEEPKRSRILSRHEVGTLKRLCRKDRWPFFWTLLESGARMGEVLNLCGADVSADEDAITFRSQDGSKGRGQERRMHISSELAKCLRMLGVVNSAGRFCPITRSTAQGWWRALARVAAINGVTIHGFRSTFITRTLDANVALVDVRSLSDTQASA